MRAPLILAAGLMIAIPAIAQDLFAEGAVAAGELSTSRGGTDGGTLVQANESTLNGSNTGNVGVSGGAQKYSGTIAPATVTNNHGITAVMQNTGDLVNMNNATSVNVYMR